MFLTYFVHRLDNKRQEILEIKLNDFNGNRMVAKVGSPNMTSQIYL